MYKPKYFTEDEFQKVSCCIADVNPCSLQRLDRAREISGIPYIINSAYRSPESEKQKGRSGTGAHTLGYAFDIRCLSSRERYLIVLGALSAGFTRIGIGETFVHMDDCPSLPNPVIWLY